VKVKDAPGVAANIFGPLAEANINVDMIVQNSSIENGTTEMTFTIPKSDLKRAVDLLKERKDILHYQDLITREDVAKVSIVGVGMKSHAGVAQKMFETLAEKGINIHVIATSEIKISVLINDEFMELAMRSLHTAFGLDA
jgi:aspartate kinase